MCYEHFFILFLQQHLFSINFKKISFSERKHCPSDVPNRVGPLVLRRFLLRLRRGGRQKGLPQFGYQRIHYVGFFFEKWNNCKCNRKKTKNICYSSIMIFVNLVLKRISLFPYQKPNYHGFVKIANSPKPSSEEGQVL